MALPGTLPRSSLLAALLCVVPGAAQEQLAHELLTRAETAARAREPERAAGLLRRVTALLSLIPPGPTAERLRVTVGELLARIDPSHEPAEKAREEAATKLLGAATTLRDAGWPRHAARLAAQAYRLRPDLASDLVRDLSKATGARDELRVPGIPAPGVAALAGKDSGLAHHFAAAMVPGVEHAWTLSPEEFTSPAGNDALILGAALTDPTELAVDLAFPASPQAAGIVFRYVHDDDFCLALAARHPEGGEYFKLLRHRDGRWEPLGDTQWVTVDEPAPWTRLRVVIDAGAATVHYRGKSTPALALPGGNAAGIVGLTVIPNVASVVPMRFRGLAVEGAR